MSYPEKAELKAALASNCSSDELCERVATEFAGKPISCSHRVPQKSVFSVGLALHVDPVEASKCAEKLCSYVDNIKCEFK